MSVILFFFYCKYSNGDTVEQTLYAFSLAKGVYANVLYETTKDAHFFFLNTKGLTSWQIQVGFTKNLMSNLVSVVVLLIEIRDLISRDDDHANENGT